MQLWEWIAKAEGIKSLSGSHLTMDDKMGGKTRRLIVGSDLRIIRFVTSFAGSSIAAFERLTLVDTQHLCGSVFAASFCSEDSTP